MVSNKSKLIKLLKLEEKTTINQIIKHISFNYISNKTIQNKVFQLLKKISIEDKKNSDKINTFLNNLKITKFKTFKIIISKAFSDGNNFEGDIQIYLNNNQIITQSSSYAKNISITNFIKWKSKNHINSTILNNKIKSSQINPDLSENEMVYASGCGSIGCCPGLFWDIIHKDNKITINKIFYKIYADNPKVSIIKIKGKYLIRKKDYYSEINRIHSIFKIAKFKTNKIPWKKPTKKFHQLRELEKKNKEHQKLKIKNKLKQRIYDKIKPYLFLIFFLAILFIVLFFFIKFLDKIL